VSVFRVGVSCRCFVLVFRVGDSCRCFVSVFCVRVLCWWLESVARFFGTCQLFVLVFG